MSPEEFVRSLQQRAPASAYLFIGPEAYGRDKCRRALVEKVLPPEEREEGLIRHDLEEVDLVAVLDDAQSFSLFARNRVIWVASAEAALPRRRAAAASDEDAEAAGGAGSKDGRAAALARYLKNPAPGTVLVFDCSRYEFDGDDKAKVERVQKFYSSIPVQVEFARYTPEAARRLAVQLAREKGLKTAEGVLDLLVEVAGGDASRIASEIEKLSLYAGTGRLVKEDDLWNLTPNAKAATVFSLVAALGRKDRVAALESLDVLVREGEYLPLALSFLATQFRLALVAREARVLGASQVQSFFQKQGVPMWRSRAEQVAQTAAAFSAERLRRAIVRIYETDKALRDTRPDDRTVMERFVLELTGA